MNDFSITTRLTAKEYGKAIFIGLYKKPAFILAAVLGLYFATTIIVDYLQVMDWYQDTPTLEMVCGAFLLMAPVLVVFIAVRQFAANPSCQKDITYTFSNNGFTYQGPTFKSELLWAHIIKQKELGKFLILYHNKQMGNFIDKTQLTAEQLQFIKSKVEEK